MNVSSMNFPIIILTDSESDSDSEKLVMCYAQMSVENIQPVENPSNASEKPV